MVRLREADSRCDFHDSSREIRDQIVMNGTSDSLRRKYLREDLNLNDLLSAVRSSEIAEKQAAIMGHIDVKLEHVHQIHGKPGRYSNKFSSGGEKPSGRGRQKWFSCDGIWLHQKGKLSCPAHGHQCKV